ncbi:MAG: condensation domain-containing protein [Acidobacteria bacterium]|nr:condensation domain-containing protein [Acidobacteriota bacterium]
MTPGSDPAADPGGAPAFREVLSGVGESVLGANAHGNVLLERSVDELRVPGSLSYNPVFQIWFVLDNAPVHGPQLDDLAVRPLRVESAALRHDLLLTVREFTGAMVATLEYGNDLFDRETILRPAEELEVALSQAGSSPDAPLTRFHERIDAERARRRSAEPRDMDLEMKKRLEAGRRKAVRP